MLRANNSRLSVTPARLRSGISTIAGAGLMEAVGNKYLPGASRSRFGSKALTAPFGSMPEGYVHPQAWILPQKPGSLKVYPAATTVFTSAANLNIGRPLAGDITITFTASASLDMVVAFNGDADISFTTAGSLDGIVNASGDANVTFTTSAALDMLVAIVGTSSVTFTVDANQSGVTSLSGAVTPFTTLSPESLSRAVWDTQIADHNDPGSTGAALSAAGSAGDPWSTSLPGSYTGTQAGALFYVMQQILRNKTKTDPDTGLMTVYADDGTTVLLTANVFNDASGTTPYNGTAGINSRDRLA